MSEAKKANKVMEQILNSCENLRITGTEMKKVMDVLCEQLAKAQQEAEIKLLEKLLDPELIAKYGETQKQRMAINRYLRLYYEQKLKEVDDGKK